MAVISLKDARSRRRGTSPVRPPPALGRGSTQHDAPADEEMDYRTRMQQNLAAFAVVILIVVLGTWLMDRLRTYSQLQACLEAGHRNCMPLASKYLPQR